MIKQDPDEDPIKILVGCAVGATISFGLALMIAQFYVGWSTFFVAPGAAIVGCGVGFIVMAIYLTIRDVRYNRHLEKERKAREANRQ